MKKVLYVLNNMNIGGTEKSFLNLVEDMSSEEYDITLLLLEKKGGFLEMIPARVHIEVLEKFDLIKKEVMDPPISVARDYLRKGKLFAAAGILITHLLFKITHDRTSYYRFALRMVKKRRGYDEVHAYAGPFDFISALIVYRFIEGKKVQWIHFDVSKIWFDLGTSRILYRKMNEIRVVSEDAKKELLKLLPEVEEKTVVSRNRVSRESCRRMASNRLGFTDGFKGIRIVTLGRLSKEKGQDIIPIIAAELKKKGYLFRWYLIGDGDLRSKIEEEIKKLDIGENVCLLGTILNPYPFLKDSDLYVQTSLHEGFCLSLSEARAFDLPVISTECSGAHEQLDGCSDCLIVPRSARKLFGAIEKTMVQKKKQFKND